MSNSVFKYRMGAGFAGDVNRTHPAEIEAALTDVTHPPTKYGWVGVLDATSHNVRQVIASDQSDATLLLPFGLLVRPYPFQQQSGGMSAAFGDATPPIAGIQDWLRSGLIMVKLNAGVTAPVKGGRVYVWAAATSGAHVQGGFETDFSSTNTVELDARYTYNGPADSDGVTEVSANV